MARRSPDLPDHYFYPRSLSPDFASSEIGATLVLLLPERARERERTDFYYFNEHFCERVSPRYGERAVSRKNDIRLLIIIFIRHRLGTGPWGRVLASLGKIWS